MCDGHTMSEAHASYWPALSLFQLVNSCEMKSIWGESD